MSQLGEAQVPIRATLDKLDSDLGQARGRIQSALGGIGRIAATAGAVAAGGMAVLTGAAAAAAGGMAALAANAEPLIGLQQGFATTTERIGTSADTMLDKLEDASGGLITNRDLMASFNKAASLVSDDFASQLPDAMGLVQRAALATGQDMGFLFDSLVTGVGRVSPMILDNLGIQVALADVTDRAAEMFGKSTSELSKQEQQAALTAIVMEKLNDAYGDVPDVEMPFARARTAIANLKDEIGARLLPIIGPLFSKLMDVAEGALPALMEILDRDILPVLQNVTDAFGGFIDDLVAGEDPLSAVSTLLGELGVPPEVITAIQDVASAVGLLAEGDLSGAMDALGVPPEVAETIQAVATGIGDVAEAAGLLAEGDLSGAMDAFSLPPEVAETITNVSEAIGNIGEKVGEVAGLLGGGDLQGALLSIFPEDAAAGILTVFTVISDAAMAFVDTIVQTVWPQIQPALQSIGESFSELGITGQTVGQVLKVAGIVIGTVLLAVVGIVAGAISGIAGGLATLGESFSRIFGNIRGLVEGWVTFFSNAFQAIKALLAGDFPGALEFAKAALGGLVQTFTQGWLLIGNIVRGAVELVIGIVGGFVEGIVGFFTSLHERLVGHSIIPEMLMAIVAVFTSTFLDLVTKVGDWIEDIISAIRSKVTGFVEIGRDLVEGLKEGLRERFEALGGFVSDLVSRLPEWVKNLLGIGSPSKVFMEIGYDTMEGLAVGMEDAARLAERAVRRAVGGLSDVAVATSPRIPTLPRGGFSTSPAMAGAGAGGGILRLEIPIYLDGKEVGRASFDGTMDEARARGININTWTQGVIR